MNLSVVSAKYVAPLKVELDFSDGTVKACGAVLKRYYKSILINKLYDYDGFYFIKL